jgi:pimeloyl-ACP methyl ester carboxylesterase
MVEELRTLLQRADVKPPYVLVGASFGGLNVQLYQARYPKEVRGIVLVDSIHPDLDVNIERVLTAAQAQERRTQLAQNGEGVSFSDLLASDAQLKAAMRPTMIPIVVLRHGLPFEASADYPSAAVEALWKRLEEELAARSTTGSVVVATKSHHRIAESEPDLVVMAIKKVIDSTIRP